MKYARLSSQLAAVVQRLFLGSGSDTVRAALRECVQPIVPSAQWTRLSDGDDDGPPALAFADPSLQAVVKQRLVVAMATEFATLQTTLRDPGLVQSVATAVSHLSVARLLPNADASIMWTLLRHSGAGEVAVRSTQTNCAVVPLQQRDCVPLLSPH